MNQEQEENLEGFKRFLTKRGFVFPLNLAKLKKRFPTYSGGEKTMIIFVLNNIYGIGDFELSNIEMYEFHKNNISNLDDNNKELIENYRKNPYEF